MENLYSIRINNTGRYVKYCDEHWYETDAAELRLFTKQQAESIEKQLRHHYVYSVTISNGTDILNKPAENKQEKPVGKKNFKFTIKKKF